MFHKNIVYNLRNVFGVQLRPVKNEKLNVQLYNLQQQQEVVQL